MAPPLPSQEFQLSSLKSLPMLPARRFRVVTICAPGPALRGRISE
jgi:hypothetical protein